MSDDDQIQPAPAADDQQPKLTRRERIFCDLYLTGLTGAAAIRTMEEHKAKKSASPAQAAYLFLRRPAVKTYLAERRKSQDETFGIRKERVLRRLNLASGEGNIKNLYDENGKLIDISVLPEDVAAMISSIEVEDVFEGQGEARTFVGQLRKVKLIDPNKAAEVLARCMGWNRDKLEIDSDAPPPVIQLVAYPDDDDAPVPAQPPTA